MIIILLGKSNSGKTTIFNNLNIEGFEKIVSATTRPKRKNEIEGIDYHFISKEDFLIQEREKRIIAPRSFINANNEEWFYGVPTDKLLSKGNKLIILDPEGLYNLLEIVDEEVHSFYITASDNTRIKRAKQRGDNIEEVIRRITSDYWDFYELFELSDFVVDNEYKNVDDNTNLIKSVIKSLF